MTIDLHKAQTVILFLPYADPLGIRVAMIQMSTIHAMAFPADDIRIQEPEFASQLSRPGIYVLVGKSGDQTLVRIGQSENVAKRLSEHRHAANKSAASGGGSASDEEQIDHGSIYPYWDTTLAFTSKDETLTTGHIRYIERRLTRLSETNPEIQVIKGQMPSDGAGGLPLHEKATCEAFISQVRLISGVLGHDYFVVAEGQTATNAVSNTNSSGTVAPDTVPAARSVEKFNYTKYGLVASMITDGATLFKVLQGSQARIDEAPALPGSTKVLRSNLRGTGILSEENGRYVFSQDQEFKSLAAATQAVSGSTDWGKVVWKLPSGETLGAWLEPITDPSTSETPT